MTPSGSKSFYRQVNLLLRGNHAEFYVVPEELPHLEETLTEILVMPINDPRLIRLSTTNGVIHFMSNHLTGWVVQDTKPEPEAA